MQTKISWQAPQFRSYEKNLGWYVTFISLAVLLCAFFVIVQNDIFGAIAIGITAVIALLVSNHKPETVTVELGEKSLKFGNIEFPYKQIKHFWIVHTEKHQTVNLETTTFVNNMLVLELAGQDPEEVRQFLVRHIPEHTETRETFAQKVMHWIKF